ncbi:MAG: transglutaminase-like domain-containing protein [Casimicrobiaceae bacterium]
MSDVSTMFAAVEAPSIARVRLTYSVELAYEVLSPTVFAFNVHAAQTDQQRVVDESCELTPQYFHRLECESFTGNRVLRVETEAGPFRMAYRATVELAHHFASPGTTTANAVADIPIDAFRYLRTSRYCQVDKLTKVAWFEFGQMSRGYDQVAAIRDWVQRRTVFQPGSSNPGTSALETLTEHSGVCRDFAHLMIGFCRALNYPARFVTGVDYGAAPALGPPDFHAYVEVLLGSRWYLFDPTGIATTTGLVRIGTGRDAADASFATIFGNVRSGMPVIDFSAANDPANGIGLPQPTPLAISLAQA